MSLISFDFSCTNGAAETTVAFPVLTVHTLATSPPGPTPGRGSPSRCWRGRNVKSRRIKRRPCKGENAMRLKHLVLGAAVASLVGAAGPASEAVAQDSMFVP